ncbi:hypothetical protein EBU95_21300 [bacterium]|nr:hypothetical protein [bacterium]
MGEGVVGDGLIRNGFRLGEGLDGGVVGLGEGLHGHGSLRHRVLHGDHHAVGDAPHGSRLTSPTRPTSLKDANLGLLGVHLDDDALGTLAVLPAELNDHSDAALFADHCFAPWLVGDFLGTVWGRIFL